MEKRQLSRLSKRERQIMDTFYMLGEATASQVLEHMPEQVGDASVRKLIRIIEQKGYLKHRREGHSYVYTPIIPKDVASRHAVKHLLRTFFRGSASQAISALLDASEGSLSEEDIAEIAALIRKAEVREKKGRS
jgi:BlaI family penicillinase repressor